VWSECPAEGASHDHTVVQCQSGARGVPRERAPGWGFLGRAYRSRCFYREIPGHQRIRIGAHPQVDVKGIGIQDQMAQENMTLVEINARKFMNEESISFQNQYEEILERLEREHQKLVKEKDNEIPKITLAIMEESATAGLTVLSNPVLKSCSFHKVLPLRASRV